MWRRPWSAAESIAPCYFGESQVRTGHLLVGILKTRGLRAGLVGISKEFDKVGVDALTERFDEFLSSSPEAWLGATDGFQVGGGAVPGEASAGCHGPRPAGQARGPAAVLRRSS